MIGQKFGEIFNLHVAIIESVDSINRDDPGTSLTQYITNASISQARYTFKHFKHHHCYL